MLATCQINFNLPQSGKIVSIRIFSVSVRRFDQFDMAERKTETVVIMLNCVRFKNGNVGWIVLVVNYKFKWIFLFVVVKYCVFIIAKTEILF